MIFRQTYLKKFQIYTCALIISVILPLTKINMCKQYTCSCEFIFMLITFIYKVIIIMLTCYVTIKLLRQTCLLISSIVVSCSGPVVNDFTWIHCASCLFNTEWFIHMLLLIGLTFLTHPPNKRNVSQTPLHTVSKKHVVQPENRSKIGHRCEPECAPGVSWRHARARIFQTHTLTRNTACRNLWRMQARANERSIILP